MPDGLRLIIVSGLSGSGKSVALHVLEDLGYYCIDNLPAGLLVAAVNEFRGNISPSTDRLAVGVDARNHADNLDLLPDLLRELQLQGVNTDVIFLQASDEILLKRYGESRRRHPLAVAGTGLRSAIESERAILEEIELSADLVIDTSTISIYQLADTIRSRVDQRETETLSVLVESFGFKYGIPADADFVFDLRSLPNPYWTLKLRGLTGLDNEVQEFLDQQEKYTAMYDDISAFLERWVPHYRDASRGYITIAIGCTGGQHRSVYMVEKIAARLRPLHDDVLTRHNALPQNLLIQD
jgi:UPF0042 nucleotide-binding protein